MSLFLNNIFELQIILIDLTLFSSIDLSTFDKTFFLLVSCKKYHERAKSIFKNSNNILDFDITDIMFNGSIDDLKKTDITQPAIFIHSYICYELGKIKNPSSKKK